MEITMANKDSTKHPRAKNFELSPREITIVQNWEALLGLAPKLTAVVEGCALSTIYTRLATGEYQALKDQLKACRI
jgi:hypothetical protein